MKTVRVTLISDATNEYPQNKNNAFKVRLPVPLNLEGHQWQSSLWSVSVPDAGHSSSVIHSDKDTKLLNYHYTLTKRHKESGNWFASFFESKDKTVTLKDVMSSSYPVLSGQQLWQNILTHMDQTMMEDIKATFDTWKTAKGNSATVSLKSTWKPTFEWRANTLVLKKVALPDLFGRDTRGTRTIISSIGIHVDFVQKFGLLIKDKSKNYLLGPNLMYVLPTTTYTDETPPVRKNANYQWLGDHLEGITP